MHGNFKYFLAYFFKGQAIDTVCIIKLLSISDFRERHRMEEEEGEEYTSMAMDSSSPTDLPFIKANLTLSKFFNVSVPIEDKFNFRWHLDKNNLTEQVNFRQ